jgi:hypothetical protein
MALIWLRSVSAGGGAPRTFSISRSSAIYAMDAFVGGDPAMVSRPASIRHNRPSRPPGL